MSKSQLCNKSKSDCRPALLSLALAIFQRVLQARKKELKEKRVAEKYRIRGRSPPIRRFVRQVATVWLRAQIVPTILWATSKMRRRLQGR
jgi:hypothetical protein